MHKVIFKLPFNTMVRDTAGFEGNIVSASQLLNGCIKYTVQPVCKDIDKYVDAYDIDEQSLTPKITPVKIKDWSYDFKFEPGRAVTNMINGFKGIVIQCRLDRNKCEVYCVEGEVTKDGKRVYHSFFVQELLGDAQAVTVKQSATGCMPTKSERR